MGTILAQRVPLVNCDPGTVLGPVKDYLTYLCRVFFRLTFTAVGMLSGVHRTPHGSLRAKIGKKERAPKNERDQGE